MLDRFQPSRAYRSLSSQPVDFEKLTVKVCLRVDRGMNSLRLSSKVWVKRADDDACMLGPESMQVNEMFPIESKDRTPFTCGEGQYVLVRNSLAAFASLLNGEKVVSKLL